MKTKTMLKTATETARRVVSENFQRSRVSELENALDIMMKGGEKNAIRKYIR